MADGKGMPPALAKKLGKTTASDTETETESETGSESPSDSPAAGKKKSNPLMDWAKKKAG